MPRVYESKENAKENYLKTHYYKAMLDPMMDAVIDILEKMGAKITGINHDYLEIAASHKDYDITVKVFMYAPYETAVDYFIDSRILFDFGKTRKQVINVLFSEIGKRFEFKGVGLHP